MLTPTGYYTQSNCVYGQKPDETELYSIVYTTENGGVLIVDLESPAETHLPQSQPQRADCIVGSCQIEAQLINSGHYKVKDGIIQSRYFPVVKSNRKPDGSCPAPTNLLLDNGGCVEPQALIVGTAEDIKPGKRCAHNQGLECFTGIDSMVRIQNPCSPPIYVTDNHTFAYYFWKEALALHSIEAGALLAHFDRHPDDSHPSLPENKLTGLDAEASYARQELGIASFINPAIHDGTVESAWFFKRVYFSPQEAPNIPEAEALFPLEKLQRKNTDAILFLPELIERALVPSKAILDIDLDLFVNQPNVTYVATADGKWKAVHLKSNPSGCALEANFVGSIAKYFGVINLATSPGFADQDGAIICAQQIVSAIANNANCN